MHRVPAKGVWPCFALIMLAPLAVAQKPSAISLIPTADWRVLNSRKAVLDVVREFGGDPAVDREYGVSSLEIRSCQLGDRTLGVIVEPSPDASTAYGLLTFYQNGTMTPVAGLPLALVGSEGALMARGRYFFRVPRRAAPASDISNNDLRALLFILANSRPPGQANANLSGALPRRRLVPGSEKYLLGEEAARRVLPSFRTDLIGFSLGAELQMGDYSTGKSNATVLAIAYPTPQIARAKFGEMGNILGFNQDRGPSSIFGKRLGSYLILVLNSQSPATAKPLLDMFRESGQVTQDERYPGDKSVPAQMADLILANMIFVLILSGIAIGGGFLFFLSREFAKRWLPQTQWGAQDDATIITLKLS
jgi:hypothetical protein